MKTISLTLFLMAACMLTFAQKYGGGNLNPGVYTNDESIRSFQDMKFGLSIHWGPSSIGGKEISWSRDKEIPKEVYDNYYKQFNPEKFDANEWLQLASDAGMKYISITAKHHDGFCLWPSAFTSYDIENTPFKRDILAELSAACREKGIVFGTYYSLLDWYQPDYKPYDHGGPGELTEKFADTPQLERYLVYMKSQLNELVTKYQSQIIQFDGEWDSTWTHQLGCDMYLYLKKLDDKILVSSRTDKGRYNQDPKTGKWNRDIYAGDFEERERMVEWVNETSKVHGKSDSPWQAWVTIDKAQWSYNPKPKLLSSDEIIQDLALTIGDNGNYLMNIGPQPDGSFNPEMAQIIRQVGKWVKVHSDAIYGTRGGPFSSENNYTSTIKNDVVYVFILSKNLEKIELNTTDYRIKGVTDYQGKPMNFSTTSGIARLNLPAENQEPVAVVKLYLDKK